MNGELYKDHMNDYYANTIIRVLLFFVYKESIKMGKIILKNPMKGKKKLCPDVLAFIAASPLFSLKKKGLYPCG